jgi:hypothetical protein
MTISQELKATVFDALTHLKQDFDLFNQRVADPAFRNAICKEEKKLLQKYENNAKAKRDIFRQKRDDCWKIFDFGQRIMTTLRQVTEVCSLCKESFHQTTDQVKCQLTDCGHHYCKGCIEQLVLMSCRNTKCVACQQVIATKLPVAKVVIKQEVRGCSEIQFDRFYLETNAINLDVLRKELAKRCGGSARMETRKHGNYDSIYLAGYKQHEAVVLQYLGSVVGNRIQCEDGSQPKLVAWYREISMMKI